VCSSLESWGRGCLASVISNHVGRVWGVELVLSDSRFVRCTVLENDLLGVVYDDYAVVELVSYDHARANGPHCVGG